MAGISRIFWLCALAIPVLCFLRLQNTETSSTFGLSTSSSFDRSNVAIIITGLSAFPHLEKIQPLAAGLADAGYPVSFVTGSEFKNMAPAGTEFEALDGPEGWGTAEELSAIFAGPEDGDSALPDDERPLAKIAFIAHMHEHSATIQRLMKKLYQKHEKVVYIHDMTMFALLPTQLGASGILPDVSMSLGLAPITLDSHDTFPFQATQPPDTSERARHIHRKAYLEIDNYLTVFMNQALKEKLDDMGAVPPYPGFWNAMGSQDDYIVQLGIPEFEYNRTDLQPKVRFLGLPNKTGGSREMPQSWQDILDAKASGKKLVVVSQGSAWPDLKKLLIPSLQALADRDDLLVVGTTVMQEPEEVAGLVAPSNAIVTKYIPFDRLLPEADLLIGAGGFGTVLQAIKAGVPMVLAGQMQDKAHIGTLAEHVGIALNMRTDTPSIKSIKAAVTKILGEKNGQISSPFKENIRRLQRLSKGYDPVRILDSTIIEAVSS